ncbi:hypothetical protein ACFLIM_18105 [Nonomuraea sp. M3C6]|uniref:SnoaL-like domain-containing protein n=1 Tax=Nonomuraea marmarensis TaxID=3351344 RepID=A0ABW7ACP7_9ACTN
MISLDTMITFSARSNCRQVQPVVATNTIAAKIRQSSARRRPAAPATASATAVPSTMLHSMLWNLACSDVGMAARRSLMAAEVGEPRRTRHLVEGFFECLGRAMGQPGEVFGRNAAITFSGHEHNFYLLRGSYTTHMLRTPDGWRIERMIQHVGWSDGNNNAVAEAVARTRAKSQS